MNKGLKKHVFNGPEVWITVTLPLLWHKTHFHWICTAWTYLFIIKTQPPQPKRPQFLNGFGLGRVGWRVFKERSSETRYPKKILQGFHNTVCSHVMCNDLLSMRCRDLRAEGQKQGMFPSCLWSTIPSKLYPFFGGRKEQMPQYLSGFSCSLCTPTQKSLSDCLAHEILGP